MAQPDSARSLQYPRNKRGPLWCTSCPPGTYSNGYSDDSLKSCIKCPGSAWATALAHKGWGQHAAHAAPHDGAVVAWGRGASTWRCARWAACGVGPRCWSASTAPVGRHDILALAQRPATTSRPAQVQGLGLGLVAAHPEAPHTALCSPAPIPVASHLLAPTPPRT
jgi:hypothetical protein